MGKNRRWVYATLILVGSFLGGTVSTSLWQSTAYALWPLSKSKGKKPSKEIRTNRLAIIDQSGKDRIVLQVGEDGLASVALYDENEKDRAEVHVTSEGAGAVAFYDSGGNKRLVMGEGVRGNVGLGIFGTSGQKVAVLGESPDQEVTLTLLDHGTGVARAALAISKEGTPALTLFDAKGMDRAELHLKADGTPGLALADENGNRVTGAP